MNRKQNRTLKSIQLMVISVTAVLAASVTAAGCSAPSGAGADGRGTALVSAPDSLPECPICDIDLGNYQGALTGEEIDGLLRALNDEYHAWAIYDQVIADFGAVRPFVNIREAEARHAEALKRLFRTYGLPIPENPWIGNTERYASVADACAAGVKGEIVNRDLYTYLFGTTDRADVITVYQALQRASEENHLPAFQRCSRQQAEGD